MANGFEKIINESFSKYFEKKNIEVPKRKINESWVTDTWEKQENPLGFAKSYHFSVKILGHPSYDETTYKFTGRREDIERAINDGCFYSANECSDDVADLLIAKNNLKGESLNEAAPRDLINGIKHTIHGYRNGGDRRVSWVNDGRATTVDDQLDYENADMEEITPQDVLRMKKDGEDLSDIYVLDDKGYLVKLDATGRADDEGSDWLTSRGSRRNNQSLKTTLANANKIYKGKISTVRETQPEKWQSRTSDPDERWLNKNFLGADHRKSGPYGSKEGKYMARNYSADSTNPVPKYKEFKARINDAQAIKNRNNQNLDSTRRYIARQIQQLADEKKFVDADNIEQDAKISKNRAEIDNLLNSRRRNKNESLKRKSSNRLNESLTFFNIIDIIKRLEGNEYTVEYAEPEIIFKKEQDGVITTLKLLPNDKSNENVISFNMYDEDDKVNIVDDSIILSDGNYIKDIEELCANLYDTFSEYCEEYNQKH